MRCSFFESQLDAYIEGTLSAASRARLDAHLASCANCAALLAEFRIVDALLHTPRLLEPAPNFTTRVMADLRSLPPPRVHRSPLLAVLATYVAFGWITIGAFLWLGGGAARAMLATIDHNFARIGAAVVSLANVTSRTFGAQTFDVTAAMSAVLGADVLVAASVVVLYAVRRSRRRVRVTGSC